MSDRIFGLIVIAVALGYGLSATGIEKSFFSDPMGPRAFPYLVTAVAVICGAVIAFRPDAEPTWPSGAVLLRLAFATAVLVVYAELLKPLGFLIPTALAAGIISYLIRPAALTAALTGVGLSLGLFVIFKYGLDLGLVPVPKSWMG